MAGTTVGTIGSPWRATVTDWGAIDPWGCDAGARLDWWIGGDDRWHAPQHEASRRQRRIDGAPVVETSVRVPSGDAIQRVYCVADHGGLTMVELENRSPVPFAVAVTRSDLLASRPPGRLDDEASADALTCGVPADTTVYAVAHRTTLRLALAHDGRGRGDLPAPAPPSAEQVAHGWQLRADQGIRLVVPDPDLAAALVSARCDLLLGGAPCGDDPAGYLLGVAELARLGEDVGDDAPEIAAAAERIARRHRSRRFRAGPGPWMPWDDRAALEAAGEVLARLGDERAAADVGAALERVPVAAPPSEGDDGLDAARVIAAAVRRLVAPMPGGADLLTGLPPAWIGHAVEAHRVPVPAGEVSVAARWHGPRPALLWECSSPMHLRATTLDPSWSAEATARGEALLAEPA